MPWLLPLATGEPGPRHSATLAATGARAAMVIELIALAVAVIVIVRFLVVRARLAHYDPSLLPFRLLSRLHEAPAPRGASSWCASRALSLPRRPVLCLVCAACSVDDHVP